MRGFSDARFAAASLVFGCVVFGMGSLIVKFVGVGSFALAWWRLLIAAAVFAVLMKTARQKFPQSRRALGFALLSGVFLGLDLAFWHESVHALGPGMSTVLNSLQIFFLAAFARIFFDEKQSTAQLLGLCAAVAGVVLMTLPQWQAQGSTAYGVFIGLASGAMLAASMTAIRQTHAAEKTAIFPLMLLSSLGGAAVLTLPALWLDGARFFPASAAAWGWVAVYGIVMQCMAWGLIAFSIPLLSLTLIGLLLLTEPVAALLIDYFGLGREISAVQWLGVGLTLSAVFLGTLKPKRAAKTFRQPEE